MPWTIDVTCRRSKLPERLKDEQEKQHWLQSDPWEREQAISARHAAVLLGRLFTEEDDPVLDVTLIGNRTATVRPQNRPYAHSVSVHVFSHSALDDPDELRLTEEAVGREGYELESEGLNEELRCFADRP